MRALLSIGLLAALVLSGCAASSEDGSSSLNEPNKVDATDTTGGIRGVVVDQSITPIVDAVISIAGAEKREARSDENGGFVVSGLKPGTYLVKASHPFFEDGQTSAEVVAGESEPKVTKIQLNQVIFGKPFAQLQKFKGYIECSADIGGALFSEECGEGVGVECVMPPLPCGRVGGLDSNQVQTDFFLGANDVKSLLVETTWTPTIGAATSGHLRVIVATDFVCDPFCGGNFFYDNLNDEGACNDAPVIQRNDESIAALNLTGDTRISHFVWACGTGGTLPIDLQLGQSFEFYVTASYLLPLPEGYSFLAGSPEPFK
ncbi:MAG: carboxypeptidase-like regulatory domain-containing protein [Candidatus Thermoplasmatota archaeon]